MAAWRDSALRARLLGVDARVTLAWFVWLFHMREWTAVVAVVSTLVFMALEYFGYPLEAAVRGVRSWLAGREIRARPIRQRRE